MKLRLVVDDDVETFFHEQSDPEAAAMAAFQSRNRADHFAHWRKILSDPTLVARTIVVDERVAGNVVSWLEDDWREIGYWINREFWGRGIATAALGAFLEVVDDRPLYAWVARHNAASIRVLEKVGFSFDRSEGDHSVYKLG